MVLPDLSLKKSIRLVIITIVTIVALILLFNFFNSDTYNAPSILSNSLSNNQILNIIKPKIDSYCSVLESNANTSACPACMFTYPTDKDYSYEFVNNLSEGRYNSHKYTILKTSNGYLVTMKLHLTYGRNDRPGNQIVSFNLDNDGKIINQVTPVAECK